MEPFGSECVDANQFGYKHENDNQAQDFSGALNPGRIGLSHGQWLYVP